MSIYDRAAWPSPEANPLVILLQRGDDWYSNEEIVIALGLSAKRALLCNQTVFGQSLAEDDTAIVGAGWLTPGKRVSASHSGQQRVFSRKALVLAAMRTKTVNAAAFRDWLAARSAGRNGVGAPL